jgi:hypothetical protein
LSAELYALAKAVTPIAGFLVAIFAVECIANVVIHHDHPAYEMKTQAVRFGQAIALVYAIVAWEVFARTHHLPAGLLAVFFAAGSMLLAAVPVIATAIWKSHQVQQ